MLATNLSSQTLPIKVPIVPLLWCESLFVKEFYTYSYGPDHLNGSIIYQELHPLRSLPSSIPHPTPILVELALYLAKI